MNVALVSALRPMEGSDRCPAVARREPGCADCALVAAPQELHSGGGKGTLVAVLKWHSLQNAVQDGPPYRRAFRLPLATTALPKGYLQKTT